MSDDANGPEVLTEVPTEIEAATIVAALAARGVKADMTGGFTAGFRTEAPGWVRVVVRRSDLEQARSALDEIKSERSEIDWTQVDVGQPEE